MKVIQTQPHHLVTLCFVLLVSCWLQACSDSSKPDSEMFKAVHIENSDECHLCGMIINQFPGPKGQLFEKGKQTVRKFCSTVDLFSYALQPENKHNIKQIFVHDMSDSPWNDTQATELIDAQDAWYVAGHQQKGAMGPTIASFKTHAAAEIFLQTHGGYSLRYTDISAALMLEMSQARMMMP